MTRLSFISLNIEMHKHLDRVRGLLNTRKPDVYCLQEVFASDAQAMADDLGYDHVYAPMSHNMQVPGETLGIAIFARGALRDVVRDYYVHTQTTLPHEQQDDNHARCFLHAMYIKDGVAFHIGTTHFPRSPYGDPDDRQRRIFKDFLPILEKQDDIMFAGDFNAPRGTEIFDAIATRFTDNIPTRYTTSIDGNLHRAGPLPYMIDGLFTTPQYTVTHAELVDGVSDHMAIVAEIEKNAK